MTLVREINANENEKKNMIEKYGIKAGDEDGILALFKIQTSIPFVNFNNQNWILKTSQWNDDRILFYVSMIIINDNSWPFIFMSFNETIGAFLFANHFDYRLYLVQYSIRL